MIDGIIKKAIVRFRLTPYDINNGDAFKFAAYIVDHLSTSLAKQLFTEDFIDLISYPTHSWILFNNKHYDAECTNGVNYYQQLPIFRRFTIYVKTGRWIKNLK